MWSGTEEGDTGAWRVFSGTFFSSPCILCKRQAQWNMLDEYVNKIAKGQSSMRNNLIHQYRIKS